MRSYKEIERANTDLVGENMTLHIQARGEFFFLGLLFLCSCSSRLTFCIG